MDVRIRPRVDNGVSTNGGGSSAAMPTMIIQQFGSQRLWKDDSVWEAPGLVPSQQASVRRKELQSKGRKARPRGSQGLQLTFSLHLTGDASTSWTAPGSTIKPRRTRKSGAWGTTARLDRKVGDGKHRHRSATAGWHKADQHPWASAGYATSSEGFRQPRRGETDGS